MVERLILTLKYLLSCLLLVPDGRKAMQRELDTITDWYNTARPHTWLGGARRTKPTMATTPPTASLVVSLRRLAARVALRPALDAHKRQARGSLGTQGKLLQTPKIPPRGDARAGVRQRGQRFAH